MIMWFQKISIPPPRRELEIPKEWGVKENTIPPPQRELEIPKEMGVKENTIPPPPPTEGIGNSEGEGGGSQRPRKFHREGGLYD